MSFSKKCFVQVCIIMLFSGLLFAQNSDSGKLTYNMIKNGILKLEEGDITEAKVDTLFIERNGGIFTLTGGVVYRIPKLGGKLNGFVYNGKGNFKYTPPNVNEQNELQRHYSKKAMDENFEKAFFLFNDKTMDDMEKIMTFSLASDKSVYASMTDKALDYILDKDGDYVKEEFIFPFLEKRSGGFFYSHFTDNNNDPLFFMINPASDEDVNLMKRYKERFINEFEPVALHNSRKTNADEFKDGSLFVSNYKINCSIESGLDFSATASLDFVPSYNKQQCIKLYLFSELEIDSVYWGDSVKAEYYKEEDSEVLWIIPSEELKSDNKYNLKISYHGDLIEQDELGWVSIKSSLFWVPLDFERRKSMYDITFRVPEDMKLCSVGDLVSTEEDDDFVTTRWVTTAPIRNASFNLGYYEEYKLETEGLPPVTVYMSESGHGQVAEILAANGILSSGDMDEKLAADVANSVSLYEHVYGKVPLKQIFVSEIPYSHGEAFPGLIHLSWSAFQGIHDEGNIELFIAHEVAHQWWGIQVDLNSYHDQWLSEAFSHYSGLRYVQLVKKNDIFFRLLDDFKENIFSNRKYLFESGPEAGPIWLGGRTNGSETAGDYSLIVYEKGAWVLHMLRNMMIDLKTMNEDKFDNMMKDFFVSYSGKRASTEDFIQVVEKHFGEKMDWFFNQWVYNSYYPEYKVAYKTEKAAGGKYKTTLRIKQQNVPANYKMYINVKIEFEGDQFARTRIEVKGNEQEIQLPVLPLEPKKIIFNDLNSVLAEVDDETW